MKKYTIIALMMLMSACTMAKLTPVNAWGKVVSCHKVDNEIPYKSRVRIEPHYTIVVYTSAPLQVGDSISVRNILKIHY